MNHETRILSKDTIDKMLEIRGIFKPHLTGVVNDALLKRLWRYKNSKEILIIKGYGIKHYYLNLNGSIVDIIVHPMLEENHPLTMGKPLGLNYKL